MTAPTPLMGEAVAMYGDVAIVTSDNPEEAEAIIDDIMPGLANAKIVIREVDRYLPLVKLLL